ncbi:MAG: hypothetical protein IIV43_07700 [Oscillospiraceae bacterium]|nr:hypothetical protein [Oscillospiraceae bacterium]
MIEQDTIRLLRECDAGVKMGVASINEVLNDVKSEGFKNSLMKCIDEHEKLNSEIQKALTRFGDDGKNPNPMAKTMSWMKTNMMLMIDDGDDRIADLMIDGCNMGVKSLSKYLNRYQAADEDSKDIAKKLIHLESQLSSDLRKFL